MSDEVQRLQAELDALPHDYQMLVATYVEILSLPCTDEDQDSISEERWNWDLLL